MNAMSAFIYTTHINNKIGKSSEKLSTGYKINRASDNAAGLQISEKMRSQIRGLERASANAQDGISFVQTADGALNELQGLIQRGRELGVQAANDTNVNEDRNSIQKEIDALTDEINRIADQTEFNTIRIFPPGGTAPLISPKVSTSRYNFTIDRAAGTAVVTGSAATAGSVLYDKIATEFIPNAVDQILTAFPSLNTSMGDVFNLALDVSVIDGANNKLAYAQLSYSTTSGDIYSFTLKVDESDFDDTDASGTGDAAEALESTIAHEMMHTVMYNALLDGMTDYSDGTNDTFPAWLVEGAAQIAGGGFTTGWNDTLTSIEASAGTDAEKKAAVIDYLNNYTPNGRPYGHGYLATAYLGHMASGDTIGSQSNTVTAESIKSGLDKIFNYLVTNPDKTLDQAIGQFTSFNSAAEINGAFAVPSDELVNVTRTLANASALGGAGSIIANDLTTGGTNLLNNNTTGLKTMFTVDGSATVPVAGAATDIKELNLQIGANNNQSLPIILYDMSANKLGLDSINVSDNITAGNAITRYDNALQKISAVRSYYGAIQNRLEHSISNADNTAENLQTAESRIRDVNIAKEMMEYAKLSILQQAGQAIITQANQSTEGVLGLLR